VGDQAGARLAAPVVSVSLRTSLPSASITHSSGPVVPPPGAARLLTNTMWRPSGDHAGDCSPLPSVPVSCVCPLPSAFMVQMSWLRAKAIREPSGEMAGPDSACGVAVSR
jgi:hypothetical protein